MRWLKNVFLVLVVGTVVSIYYRVEVSNAIFTVPYESESKHQTDHHHNEAKELDIKMDSKNWQTLEISNLTIKVSKAYYDERKVLRDEPLVRIIAYIDSISPDVDIYCKLRFAVMADTINVLVNDFMWMWLRKWQRNDEGFQTFLLSCPNPLASHGLIPISVSLVANIADVPTNQLDVIHNKPPNGLKKPFAVCVKDVTLSEDKTLELVEWIEILRILGADKIFMYINQTHPDTTRTLKYYEAQGVVQLEATTYPEAIQFGTLTLRRKTEVASLTDCLYKHMYEYEYLLALDFDELILPIDPEVRTWKDLLSGQSNLTENLQDFDFLFTRASMFLLDNNHAGEIQHAVPSNMLFLQHIYRAKRILLQQFGAKSFQNTQQALVMHNHYPLFCIGKCKHFVFPPHTAKLQHYRRGCMKYLEGCDTFLKNTVKDLTLWNYKDELIPKFQNAMMEIKNFEA